ncbi:hypothetical protein EVAR_91651_1 [Eumeta japonica]|uniref:(+)RNA virus helicase C-terminal domain-containing protein n=1 Tax=Eumeta variegata TaxID=151549 RepID=A0A4C1Z1R1_EUMVA|nr:hypothetical protein EVAR_91651_1 [Eumeta japonica]
MDVAYALNEIYSGIYSTQEGTRSLTMDGYDINKLSISPQTLYLAHTQAGKTELKAMGCGQGKESRVLTIHEAQGLASKMCNSKNSAKKAEIYNSIQHAVVAITRHTENCIYLTKGVNCPFDPIFNAGTFGCTGAAAADTATGGTAVTSSDTKIGAVVATLTVAGAESCGDPQTANRSEKLSDFRGLIRRHRGLRRRPKPRPRYSGGAAKS